MPSRLTTAAIGLVVCAFGCDRVPSAPSKARTESASPQAPVSVRWRVSGVVTEITSGKPVSSVLVHVAGCGRGATAVTDSNGHYTIDAVVENFVLCSEPSTIKLTTIGFEAQTRQTDTSLPVTENFALVPIASPTADLSGVWILTVSASPSCAAALPEVARARSYDATLMQVGVRVTVVLASPTIAVLSQPVGGTGTFIDRTLSFVIIGDTGPIVDPGITWNYPDFIDRLSDGDAVAVMGFVDGVVNGTEIRGSMKGEFEYWSGLKDANPQGPPSAICRADNHNIIFRRQH
jgi:hypothetical protein